MINKAQGQPPLIGRAMTEGGAGWGRSEGRGQYHWEGFPAKIPALFISWVLLASISGVHL